MHLIVLVAQHTRSYFSAITLAQAKLRSRSIGILAIMVLTNSDRFKLRAKKALETGDASFKPRGEANKAMFEKMKAEFDKKAKEINLHTSSVGDRIIKEITPLVTLFNGSDSTNPQDRINARILQNAANNKANKEDRVLIREQKEKASRGPRKGKSQSKEACGKQCYCIHSSLIRTDGGERSR